MYVLKESVDAKTGYVNDTSYIHIFVLQLKNVVKPGDVVLALSGSGNSPNVSAALEYCKQQGITAGGLTGRGGGRLAQICDVVFKANSDHMSRIEDQHMIVVHLLTY